MSYGIIQQNSGLGGNPVNVPFLSPNVAGNAIVVVTVGYGIQQASASVTDTQGNVYRLMGNQVTARTTLGIFAAFNIKAGTNTVSAAPPGFDKCDAMIFEVHGVSAGNNTINVHNQAQGDPVPSINTGNFTTTIASQILVSAALVVNALNAGEQFATWSDSSGWVGQLNLHNNLTTQSIDAHVSFQIVSSTGTYSNTISQTGYGSAAMAAIGGALSIQGSDATLVSEQLQAQCFGFAIPAAAQLVDVTLSINGKQTNSSPDSFLQITQIGGAFSRQFQLPATDGTVSFDLGTAFTPAQLNNQTFGFNIQAVANASTTFDISGIVLEACFTPPQTCLFDYVKTFGMDDGTTLTLALDSCGTFWKEDIELTPEVLTPFYELILPNTFAVSVTEDNREFIALSDLQQGTDMPRSYDGTNLDRLSQCGPAAGPSVAENSTASSIIEITQAPQVEIRRVVWGNAAAVPNGIGNILTIYGPGRTFTGGQVNYASLGPNIYVGATVVLSGFSSSFPTSSGSTFDSNTENGPTVPFDLNGTYTVLSLGIHAVNGNTNELAPYFTVQAPASTYVHSYDYLYPPDSGWFFEPTLATMQTAGPVPNLNPGDQFTVTGNSQPGYNKTWTVINDLNGAQLSITQTQETTPGTGIFTYTVVSGTAPTWMANTVYQVGEEVVDIRGYIQQVATAGTSGAAAPAFSSTVGGTTIDGGTGLTWVNRDRSQMTVIVSGCVNGSVNGISPFNVTNAVIIAASSSVSGSPFLVNINDNRVLVSVAESGSAIISGTLFTFDPLAIIGTGTGGTIVQAGGLGAGTRGVVVIFETENGYQTAPSPQALFTLSQDANSLVVSNLPIGPPNVKKRIVAFTGAGGATQSGGGGFYYWIPQNVTATDPNNPNGTVTYTATVVPDNTSTTATFTFTDAILLAADGISIQGNNLFAQIELGASLGVIAYSERLFAWGEQNKIQNLLNWSFDGGTAQPVSIVQGQTPLGWVADATFGTGGSVILSSVFGTDYQISNTTGSTQATWGMISQSAYLDTFQQPIFNSATTYSVRVRAGCSTGASGGTLVVDLFSPTLNRVFGSFSVALSSLGTTQTISTGTLLATPMATVPTDLLIRVYASSIPDGVNVQVGRVEPFPTLQPVLTTQFRASYANNFEAFDGVTGNLGFGSENQEPIKAAFTLFDNLYAVKTHSMYETSDNGTTEPGLWTIREVSKKVGTPSIHGVDIGEGWALICGQAGLYLFTGGNPVKISPELDGNPGIWQAINWAFGHTLWIRNDTVNRRILIGVPMITPNKWMPNFPANANPTQPNVVLMCNYRELMTAQALEGQGPVHMTFMGNLKTFPLGRKWSVWNIPASYADFITRPDTLQPIFYCSDTVPKIYEQIPGKHDDDGAPVASDYITSPFVQPLEAQEAQLGQFNLLAKYGSVLAIGSGTLYTTLYPDSITSPDAEALYPLPLANPPTYGDTEYPLNVVGRRFFQEFYIKNAGDWFDISKLTLVMVPNPWAPVSGGNY